MRKKHERNAEWIRELRVEKKAVWSNNINIITEIFLTKEQVKKVSNWKSLGPNGVQGYSLKNLTALHECIGKQMDSIISNREGIPKWITFRWGGSLSSAVDNYRPIL